MGAHAFARKWKATRFGKSNCTIKEFKLKRCVRTARRTLDAADFFQRAVQKKDPTRKGAAERPLNALGLGKIARRIDGIGASRPIRREMAHATGTVIVHGMEWISSLNYCC